MSAAQKDDHRAEVPAQIFEAFLAELQTRKVDPAIIERLRRTVLEDGAVSEKALRSAILGVDER